jgi:hypothetical protein
MLIVLAKIALAPLLLAACTFTAHRFGSSVGGWLLGLPLTSGPVSVFLFAEHGATFAEKAARATLLGVVAGAIFCACYALASSRMRWWKSLGAAYTVCFATAWMLSLSHFSLAQSIGLVATTLVMLALALSALDEPPIVAPTCTADAPDSCDDPAAGLAARMAVAAFSVVAITAVAGLLGPRVGGVLAPLPILAAVMATTSHRKGARREARGLLRGAIVGSWGVVAFFTVVAIDLGPANALPTYTMATLAALVAGGIAMGLNAWDGPRKAAMALCADEFIGESVGHAGGNAAVTRGTGEWRLQVR